MRWTRGVVGCMGTSALAALACSDAVSPEDRLPIVEGIYNVHTEIVTNSCSGLNVRPGDELFVFYQNGSRIQFRPPGFDEDGNLVLLDLGIEGELRFDGSFEMNGTYTLPPNTPGALVIGFTMEGQFDGDQLSGTQTQLASSPGGSCAVTFSFAGAEV